MEQFKPHVNDQYTVDEGKREVLAQLQELEDQLQKLHDLSWEISPHLTWALNKKLIQMERTLYGLREGVRMYFNEGVLNG